MVANVSGQTGFSFQPQGVTGPPEVRARNDQTQPREAPAADSQRADRKPSQSKDDEQRHENKKADNRKASASSFQASANAQSRGSRLDVVA